jgi:hypothetical protein
VIFGSKLAGTKLELSSWIVKHLCIDILKACYITNSFGSYYSFKAITKFAEDINSLISYIVRYKIFFIVFNYSLVV